jgi:hypothetical protein
MPPREFISESTMLQLYQIPPPQSPHSVSKKDFHPALRIERTRPALASKKLSKADTASSRMGSQILGQFQKKVIKSYQPKPVGSDPNRTRRSQKKGG